MKKEQKFEKQMCKYVFTEDELKELAGTMAMKMQDLQNIDDEKKAAMSGFKDRIDSTNLEMRSCGNKYKDGFEMRMVECEVIMDFKAGKVNYHRTDNKELARSRKMLEGERQMNLPGGKKKPKPAEKSNDEIAAENKTKRDMTSEKTVKQ